VFTLNTQFTFTICSLRTCHLCTPWVHYKHTIIHIMCSPWIPQFIYARCSTRAYNSSIPCVHLERYLSILCFQLKHTSSCAHLEHTIYPDQFYTLTKNLSMIFPCHIFICSLTDLSGHSRMTSRHPSRVVLLVHRGPLPPLSWLPKATRSVVLRTCCCWNNEFIRQLVSLSHYHMYW